VGREVDQNVEDVVVSRAISLEEPSEAGDGSLYALEVWDVELGVKVGVTTTVLNVVEVDGGSVTTTSESEVVVAVAVEVVVESGAGCKIEFTAVGSSCLLSISDDSNRLALQLTCTPHSRIGSLTAAEETPREYGAR
jgi:hypothetical protein